jgi:hypothetical protein
MTPVEVVLLDTLELVVAAAYIDEETGEEVLAAEPVVLGKVLVVAAGCALEEVSTANGCDTEVAGGAEDDTKGGVEAITGDDPDARAVDSIDAD